MTHDPFPREPLTPEEQAFARRLAQLGPQAEPSPALDARILAAARAAEADAGLRSTSRVRRWPVALGVAASLVLAIGIAWQLRPLPGPAERYSTAPAESARQPPSVQAGKTMPETIVPPRDTAVFVPSPPPLPAKPIPARAPPPMPAVVTAPAPPEPPIVFDTPAPAAPMAAPALPAPPPPAEPTTQAESNAAKTLDRVDVTGSRIRQSKAAADETMQESAIDAAAAADQAAGDEPESEVPPATADSPDVRDAWLQRIRELVAAGQTDAARASLKEFVRRHPDAPVPDDLRALQR
jgi:hypothetical protein